MSSGPARKISDHLHRLALSCADSVTDGQLLDRFIQQRDEAAFAELVARHGPMVLGVCRRIVRDLHDADDAFQATFFVLARKADDIQPRDLVGNWLFGVAYRTALKARGLRARRRANEKQVQAMPETSVTTPEVWCELQPLLDQELNRLPDAYRSPVVLCDLEGRSRKDAARHLAIAEGTLSSRLARGRQMLAKRLRRRGVTLASTALGVVLLQNAAQAAVPAALAAATVKTAALVAAGTGIVPAAVATLMNASLKSLLLTKLTAATSLVLALVVGGGMVATPRPDPSVPQSAVTTPATVAATPTDHDRFQGSWDVVFLQADGKALTLPAELREHAVTFKNNTLRTPFGIAEAGDNPAATTFKLGPAQWPRTIDLLVDGEMRSAGIYVLVDDTLTICLAPAGHERPTEFKASSDGPNVLVVLKPAEGKG